MNILDFQTMKAEGRKISMVTCYDHWSAKLLAATQVDCLLVGDSVAMVMHGYPTTVHATIEMMGLHVAAVSRGAPSKFIIGDMPFLSFRQGPHEAARAAGALLRAGAQAVKLESIDGHEDVVRHLVDSGIPVMGHLGLTPQFVNQFGGFKVQGRGAAQATKLIEDARKMEQLGCFALVLECVPSEVAARATSALGIPTIGIGAGPLTDGQVLVLHDLLGVSPGFNPKFLKRYAETHEIVTEAVNRYDSEVKQGLFPSDRESYA